MRGRLATMAMAIGVAGLLDATATAQPAPDFRRVRPVDSHARQLLVDAWRSSETVRGLVETIEDSDLIVQIESQRVGAAFRGRLRFMSAVPGCRYVRVSVRVPNRREILLPALAHELQHAVEIARAPEVRNEQAMDGLLHRIGWEWKPTVFETEAALAVEAQVRRELASARREPLGC